MALSPRTFIATAVLATLAWPALAQPSAAPASTPAAPTQLQTPATAPTAGERSLRRMPNRAKMQERMAQRQAQFKQSLQLSAAQEPAWNTFMASMQPGERPQRMERMQRQELQQLSTPERIERMRAQRAERQAQAERRADATLAFYAELNPAQQKTFDAHTARYQHHWGDKGGKKWGDKQQMRGSRSMGAKNWGEGGQSAVPANPQ